MTSDESLSSRKELLMNFWTGLIVGWLTAGPLILLILIFLSIGRDD
jgi:hypothetical protein